MNRTLLLILLLSPGAGAWAAPGPAVLARVGDTDVKTEDIREALENLDPREQAALARDPALLNQAVRSLLARQVVLREALARKWDQNPTVIDQLRRAHDNTLIESYLQSISTPPASYPSDEDIKAVYAANKSVLVTPRQWRVEQLFIACSKEADAAAVQKAQAKLAEVRRLLAQPQADFAAIARAQSDGSANDGAGEWVTESQLRPEIREIVSHLTAQAASEPVQLNDGWHVLRVLEVKEPAPLALDEARGLLTQRLRAEKARANRQAYLNQLLQEHPVSINEIALPELLPAASP